MQRPNPRQADHHDQTATRGWPRAPFGARPPRRRRQPRSQRAVKVISGKVSAYRDSQPHAPGLGVLPINRMAASSPGRVTGRSWQSPCNQRDLHPRRRHNRAAAGSHLRPKRPNRGSLPPRDPGFATLRLGNTWLSLVRAARACLGDGICSFPALRAPRPLVRLRNGKGSPLCKYQVSLPVRVAPNTGLARGRPWEVLACSPDASLELHSSSRWRTGLPLPPTGDFCSPWHFRLPPPPESSKAPTLPNFAAGALCLSGERGPAMGGLRRPSCPRLRRLRVLACR